MVKIGKTDLGEFPLILAPMEEISDSPFRSICREYGADLVYSEFMSSDGLIRNISKTVRKAQIIESERPVALQIFGHDEASLRQATEVVTAANPEIIDINFGCPVSKVMNRGAGAGALRDLPKMVRLTRAVVDATHLPVTVKTRLGLDEKSICIPELAEMLQDCGIHALAIHARTAKQKYQGHADWTWIGKVLENKRLKIPVFGNGDIDSPEKALEMKNSYPVSGIMIGRAAVGNPWLFRRTRHYLDHGELLPIPSLAERINICLHHLRASCGYKSDRFAVLEHRKHYRNYFRELPDFKPFRIRLMLAETIAEIEEIVREVQLHYTN